MTEYTKIRLGWTSPVSRNLGSITLTGKVTMVLCDRTENAGTTLIELEYDFELEVVGIHVLTPEKEFVMVAKDGEQALDMFYHPFAYYKEAA